MKEQFEIIVREKGVKGSRVHREDYIGTQQEVERRAGDLWTQGGYDSGRNVDRYQLEVKRPGQQRFMTIG